MKGVVQYVLMCILYIGPTQAIHGVQFRNFLCIFKVLHVYVGLLAWLNGNCVGVVYFLEYGFYPVVRELPSRGSGV